MNRELLTWLEALAYETKEFIDDDEIEKKELKAMHLRIQEHEADFLWLQGRTASWRRSCVRTRESSCKSWGDPPRPHT